MRLLGIYSVGYTLTFKCTLRPECKKLQANVGTRSARSAIKLAAENGISYRMHEWKLAAESLLATTTSMASPAANAHDEFNHQVAIKLSRAINTLNPNDLLAQRVIDIAKTSSVESFITG